MVYSLTYHRPKYVQHMRTASDAPSSESDNTKASSISDGSLTRTSCTPRGVPEELSFDKVIDGGCCPVILRLDLLWR